METIVAKPVPCKHWKNRITGETRGLGSALEGEGWEVVEHGWTIDWGRGQIGNGGRFIATEAEAQTIIDNRNR